MKGGEKHRRDSDNVCGLATYLSGLSGRAGTS